MDVSLIDTQATAKSAGARLADCENVMVAIIERLDARNQRQLQLVNKAVWRMAATELYRRCEEQYKRCKATESRREARVTGLERFLPPTENASFYAALVQHISFIYAHTFDPTIWTTGRTRFPNLLSATYPTLGRYRVHLSFTSDTACPPTCTLSGYWSGSGPIASAFSDAQIPQGAAVDRLITLTDGAPGQVVAKDVYSAVRTERALLGVVLRNTAVDFKLLGKALEDRRAAGFSCLVNFGFDRRTAVADIDCAVPPIITLLPQLGSAITTIELFSRPSAASNNEGSFLADISLICRSIAVNCPSLRHLVLALRRSGTPDKHNEPLCLPRYRRRCLETVDIEIVAPRGDDSYDIPLFDMARAFALVASSGFQPKLRLFPRQFRRHRLVNEMSEELRDAVALLQGQSDAVFEYIQDLSHDEARDMHTFANIVALITQFNHRSIIGKTFADVAMRFNELQGIQSYRARALQTSDEVFCDTSRADRALQRDYVRRQVVPHISRAQAEFNDAMYRLAEMMTGTGFDICGRRATRDADLRFETANPALSTELLWEAQRRLTD